MIKMNEFNNIYFTNKTRRKFKENLPPRNLLVTAIINSDIYTYY